MGTKEDYSAGKAWVRVPAQVVLGTSKVFLNTSAVFDKSTDVTWLRYSWGKTPKGAFLYDNGGRAGLPVGTFLADCRAGGSCTFVQGGQVPVPSPPPSPTPVPPPPQPTVSNCTFQNSTLFLDNIYKTVHVPLNDYSSCCELCHNDPLCAVAQMHHGPASADYDLCQLMATADQPTQHVVAPPNLELACIPKQRGVGFVTV